MGHDPSGGWEQLKRELQTSQGVLRWRVQWWMAAVAAACNLPVLSHHHPALTIWQFQIYLLFTFVNVLHKTWKCVANHQNMKHPHIQMEWDTILKDIFNWSDKHQCPQIRLLALVWHEGNFVTASLHSYPCGYTSTLRHAVDVLLSLRCIKNAFWSRHTAHTSIIRNY